MSTKKKILLLAVAVVGALAFYALGRPEWAPVAEAAVGCDEGDLDGTFSFRAHGVNPDGEPFAEAGVLTADGAGNIEGTAATVDNGVYSIQTFTCTYVMSPACMFRGPCIGPGDPGPEVQIDGAMADGNREIELVISGLPALPVGPGPVVTGVARLQ